MTKVKLCYFWHIMRQEGSLDMTIMLGEMQAAGREEKPSMRWFDSIKEGLGMSRQEQCRTVEDRTCGQHSFIGTPGVRDDSMVHNTLYKAFAVPIFYIKNIENLKEINTTMLQTRNFNSRLTELKYVTHSTIFSKLTKL